MPTKKIPETLGRFQDSYECECGGYCALDELTAEEEKECGCGREGCCGRAFLCRVCQTRWIGRIEAPEME